jgi:DNA-binding NtrC family response regulator
MVDARLVLLITPAPNAVPIRTPVMNAITSVGSSQDADLQLATVPARWLVIRRDHESLSVSHLPSGQRHVLAPGAHLELDGVVVACEREDTAVDSSAALEELASSLADAETTEDALAHILSGAMSASRASAGAIIVEEGGSYRVALSRTEDGSPVSSAEELLSDTIVREVLGSGERVNVADAAADQRYRSIPSVVSLRLRSVLCLPMRLHGRALGALFLGKQDLSDPFPERLVSELKVVASMAVPFVAQLRRAQHIRQPRATDELLGDSESLREVRRLIERIGPSDLSVLVTGESGTGKELVARAIHGASPRADKPMVALNCASVPESLLGAELFGYARGAFTGANADRKGMIEAANGSTLFLDEVGDMPMPMQAALLRVLEQREVRRLGETEPRAVDFRLVAATHRDLDAAVAEGTFRHDLLFRLREMTLALPPLRERGDDVVTLGSFFLRQAEAQLMLPMHSIGEAARRALCQHPWPGNVRELRATMRRAALLADQPELRPGDLRLRGETAPAGDESSPAVADLLGDLDRPLAEARDQFVRAFVTAVVERHGGNREDAARALGIGVRTLYRYLA